MAITFDGVDDLITGGTGDIITENGACSVYVRFKSGTLSVTTQAVIVEKGNFTTSDVGLRTDTNNNLLWRVLGATNLEAYSSTSSIANNTEYSVVVTWDGSTTASNVKFYINSTSANTHSLDQNGLVPVDNSAGTICIGNRSTDNARPFVGIIREVAVFNSVISAGSITSLITNTLRNIPTAISGCVRYFPMDDGAVGASADGATIRDVTGNGNGTGNDGANNTGLTWTVETQVFYPIRKTLTALGTGRGKKQLQGWS